MSRLAIFGGEPVRKDPFPAYNTIGDEEKAAVQDVLDSGVLSRFLGAWHPDFYGGPQVRRFEKEWAEAFSVRHAISVNSCTSGLYAAVGAAGVGPGDEIIVSPYTMTASVTAALVFNAVPVFADIDPETFCLSPESIKNRITPRTKAIIVVDIFGQAAAMDEIMDIAGNHNLVVIEDTAQAPFAYRNNRPAGTLGHIGVFSFNYHKHIHTGEGGMLVTNDDDLADRLHLIRNHGESVAYGKGTDNLVNIIGFNFRLGEIEAAIGLCQTQKAPGLITQRQENVSYLEERLRGIPELKMPKVAKGNTHVYYVHVITFDEDFAGISRDLYVQVLNAEFPAPEGGRGLIRAGYVQPLYLLPLFRQQTAYGTVQCPFKCPHYKGRADYGLGLCPTVEKVNDRILLHELFRPPMTRDDLDAVIGAFEKVHENLDELRNGAQRLASSGGGDQV